MSSAQPARKHLFVVNGAPAFLNLMRELFQEEGYAVTTTNFLPESFAQIDAAQPDVLVVDVVVGHQEGWELLERLHAAAATAGIPVLIVSTSPQLIDRARERVTRFGGDAYLGKPFDLEAMLETIRDLLPPA